MKPLSRTIAGLSLLAISAATLAFSIPGIRPAAGDDQQTFASPEDALKALREATAAKDVAALDRIFGPSSKDLMNPDAAQQAVECETFNRHLAEMANLVRQGDDKVVLYLGQENWPMPIPIVRKGGTWLFDTAAGKDEILSRRIGENELNTIDVCRAYVVAQNEFHATDWNGDDILEYAQHLRSSAAKKDGLYWEAAEDEVQSPLGPLVAAARSEGYLPSPKAAPAEPAKPDEPRPYHGYIFKILTKQGMHAPGGAYSYIINGHMVAGFALMAYPAEWGSTGIMTFIVGPRGKVFQKDLGEKTRELAPAVGEYDPDETWKPVGE